MKIEGQVIYLGPMIRGIGLYYSKTWRNGVNDDNVYKVIKACPSVAGMIVPVARVGEVLRELSFDYAHNITGTTGKYVTFYKAIQQWLARPKTKPAPSGITMKHHQHA